MIYIDQKTQIMSNSFYKNYKQRVNKVERNFKNFLSFAND